MPPSLALPYTEFFNTQNSMFFEQNNSKESKLEGLVGYIGGEARTM
jgi:hypothetical protein